MELKQCFASHVHKGSIRCMASYGKYMISSGADEYINVYDLVLKKVLTTINFYNSTVTSLDFFPNGSHFVCGNQNGDVAIFATGSWRLVKYWKRVHKCPNGVISVCVHPSGALLMTSGSNNKIVFWNLMKRKKSYVVDTSRKCPVGITLNFTIWSKTGEYFGVSMGRLAEVYHSETAVLLYTIRTSARVSCMEFLFSDIWLIGFETGEIQIHSVKKEKMVHVEKCHNARIKCMIPFRTRSRTVKHGKFNFLITADSKGVVKLWRLRIRRSDYTMVMKASVDIDCRITCMTATLTDE